MWSRVVEFMIGCWLAMSPFIFRHPASEPALWWNDMLTALVIMVLALLSFVDTLRRAHLGIILVGFWLIGFAFWNAGYPADPAYQNNIIVALLLLMFAIVPSHASDPPPGWAEWEAREEGSATRR